MNPDEIIRALRENADWCDANEYEIPLCMGEDLMVAADMIKAMTAQLSASQQRERAAVEERERRINRAYAAANNAVYFADGSDYLTALYEACMELIPENDPDCIGTEFIECSRPQQAGEVRS